MEACSEREGLTDRVGGCRDDCAPSSTESRHERAGEQRCERIGDLDGRDGAREVCPLSVRCSEEVAPDGEPSVLRRAPSCLDRLAPMGQWDAPDRPVRAHRQQTGADQGRPRRSRRHPARKRARVTAGSNRLSASSCSASRTQARRDGRIRKLNRDLLRSCAPAGTLTLREASFDACLRVHARRCARRRRPRLERTASGLKCVRGRRDAQFRHSLCLVEVSPDALARIPCCRRELRSV